MSSRIPDEWLFGRPLTVQGVADVLNISTGTVTRWAKVGMIGFYRLPSGDRRFPECEIRRIMNGEPVPEIVRQIAAEDRVRYRDKWEDGWRRNSYMASRAKQDGLEEVEEGDEGDDDA
jgi:excisionase family DNA binding protein